MHITYETEMAFESWMKTKKGGVLNSKTVNTNEQKTNTQQAKKKGKYDKKH